MLNEVEPKTRKRIYQVFALISLAIGAVGVGYSALPDVDLPAWQIVATQVLSFIGGAIGYTAQSNTETRPYELDLYDEDAEDDLAV